MTDELWEQRDRIANWAARLIKQKIPSVEFDDAYQEARMIALKLPENFPLSWTTYHVRRRLIDVIRTKTKKRRFRLQRRGVNVEKRCEYAGFDGWQAERRAQRVRDDLAIAIEKALVYADPKTKFAYQKYYLEGLSLVEIGALMKIGDRRVSQILCSFRKRVKKKLDFDRQPK